MKCVVTTATNYDIPIGQQALYPLGFGLDNWTKEAWIRPGWSSGDGKKVFIPQLLYDYGCGGNVWL